MINIDEYILKSSLILLVFYIGYWLFLRKSTFFKINRLYLLSGLVISLIIPFINFQLSEVTQTEMFITLDSIDVGANYVISKNPDIDWSNYLAVFYLALLI